MTTLDSIGCAWWLLTHSISEVLELIAPQIASSGMCVLQPTPCDPGPTAACRNADLPVSMYIRRIDGWKLISFPSTCMHSCMCTYRPMRLGQNEQAMMLAPITERIRQSALLPPVVPCVILEVRTSILWSNLLVLISYK